MKLSLDELKVDSYAVQVSESELAEVKGGTAWTCVDLSLAVVNTIIAGYAAYNSGSGGSNNSNTNGTNSASGASGSGGISGSMVIHGPDSARYQSNGTLTVYKPDSIVIRR